jgi:dipeptidyl aminopeptidase/acylaminoacyl peptidase/CubicO group peptidase (beta-lactamase class C family)
VSRRMRIDDLAALAVPSAPALSPDGSAVAYVVRTQDQEADRPCDQLWLVPTDGGEPHRLTAGPADLAPAWSPDGSRLAFLRDGQVAVLTIGAADPAVLTELDLGAGAPAWSPNSATLAFSATVAPAGWDDNAPLVSDGIDYRADGAGLIGAIRPQVHVLDVATGQVEQLTEGTLGTGDPVWSPDGARLAFTRRTGTDSDLEPRIGVYLISPGPPGPLSEPELVALGNGLAATVDFSADGSALLVTGYPGDLGRHAHLFRVPLDGTPLEGEPVDLTATLDRNVMPGAPAYPGGRPAELDARILFCLRDRGRTRLWSVAPDGAGATPVPMDPDAVVCGLSVAAGRVAIALVSPTSFGEIALVDLADGTTTLLTAHGDSEIELFVPQERTFTISDGTDIHGWLISGREEGPRPLLLDIHGGPHNAWSGTADEMHLYQQEIVAQGWSVLTLNPRGSDGYGEAFFTGVHAAWGVADAPDFLEPVAQLVAEGLADPKRLAVTGYSYGGFMTCWLTAHDQRFAAAIAGGVVSDLVSLAGTSDEGHLMAAHELGGTLGQRADRYAPMSPLTHVTDVRTPTLILHGGADLLCPVGQAQQWHTALRELDVPTRLVLYPGGAHAFILTGRPSHRIDYSHRVVDWLNQYTGRPNIDARHWQERLSVLARRHQVVGAQLGILRLGQPDEVTVATHGVLNRATNTPTTPDSVFQIGSITKVWTATLVLQLVAEGRLDLDDPIGQVLPQLRLADPEAVRTVTIRHLLTHTSGIDGDVFTDTGRGDDCLARYADRLADAGINHPPGATWSYCNSGYSLLGLVVEQLTGQTWDQALRERLLTPLGLSSTVTLPEEALRFAAAIGHEDGEPVAVWGLPRSVGPAGLITATARDVLAFARLHLTGGLAADGSRVLAAEAAAAMAAHAVDLPDPYILGDSWGLGWIRFDWDGHRLIGHDGSTLGQNAYLRILPEQGLAVTLLTNGGHTQDLYQELFREIFAEVAGVTMSRSLTPPEEPVQVDVGPYTGTYERASTRIEIEDGATGPLMRTTVTGPLAELVPDPVDEYPMVPVRPGLFLVRPPGGLTWVPLTFYQIKDGTSYLHFGARATPRTA